ncbi:SDR family oxidoreductase [Bacillus sp. DJP31]|uniref:SDR family oxidoreductase n=1 Tax=Bacillus sp. DJP31 TaxID=3409789 RepID=UPI003BB52DD9
MNHTYFFTGFPGFISTQLIIQLLKDYSPIKQVYLLVLPSMKEKAENELSSICEEHKVSSDLFTLVEGDITASNLGIKPELHKELQLYVTHFYHLAAIYDLAVPKAIAHKVNVEGTRQVLTFVATISSIERFIYFSTAYVAGKRTGLIKEDELQMGQQFHNHYDQTKYEAELLVQARMDLIPTTIIRPGIVVGHSETGETAKFDGPYFILNFLDRLRFLPIIPNMGSGVHPLNLVPIDYLIRATSYLSHSQIGEGNVYHLTNPHPYPVKDIYKAMMKEFINKKPVGTVPVSLVKSFLSISFIRKWLRVELETLDYFTWNASFDCNQAQRDLQGTNITCPDLLEMIPVIVSFYKENQTDPTKFIPIQ